MASFALSPLNVFKFQVDFFTDSLSDGAGNSQFQVCSGSFAECTGLEATMEPMTIKEGGRNYGEAQRAGALMAEHIMQGRDALLALRSIPPHETETHAS